jgi:hypothetical protein
MIAGDEALDIIDGTAGCLGVLVKVIDRRPSVMAWQAALACGERLLATARPQATGIGCERQRR